jgi:uncharacterized protein YqkB
LDQGFLSYPSESINQSVQQADLKIYADSDMIQQSHTRYSSDRCACQVSTKFDHGLLSYPLEIIDQSESSRLIKICAGFGVKQQTG